MAERIVYSTKDFTLVRFCNQYSRDLVSAICVSESAFFEGGREAVYTSFRDPKTGGLKSLDHVFDDWKNGVAVRYTYKSGKAPFGHSGFAPDPNSSYDAAIHLSSVSRRKDGRSQGGVHYGTFWYDRGGILKAIAGGSIVQSLWDSPDAPTVKFRRDSLGNWQVFRISGIQEPALSHDLKGKILGPEDVVISNGQDMVIDELVSRLTDDAQRLTFHQQTLTGHRQKTVEVPSIINIESWVTILEAVNGGWTQALQEFPIRMELLAGV